MKLERNVIQESEYPQVMDWNLAERWADIPTFSENDPNNPEWISTPTIPIDLSKEGYGIVHIKDESDPVSNPTNTVKDRAAWELTTIYRDYARNLYRQAREGIVNGNIGSLVVPRLSSITAGNVGRAISHSFEKYGLPPLKILVDKSIPKDRLKILKGLHADIYMVDLSERELTDQDIKILTNNEDGIDLTSLTVIEPHVVFYDWHVHEAFNKNPGEIYVPYGSGRLMENYISWQQRNAREQDPRLKVPVGKLTNMSVLGAEPIKKDSVADKLTKDYNPFTIFHDRDLSALRTVSWTGRDTGVYGTHEERIRQAYDMLTRNGIQAEPSACAGLALYLQRFDEGKVDQRKKSLVVSTGRGI